MPKIGRYLVDAAVNEALGGTFYTARSEVAKHKEFRRLSGITKGQWKRFQWGFRNEAFPELTVSELAIKKLEIMAKHGKSPHLLTLLKVVEHTHEVDHEQ